MTTMAQRLGLVEAAVEGADEVAFVLDSVAVPYHTRWFDLAGDYFRHGDSAMRLAVIDRLPDVISNRRKANVNLNNSANVMRLLGFMLEADNPELTALARHSGLIAVRNELSKTDRLDDDETLVGPDDLPLQAWFYRINRKRGEQALDRLVEHPDQGVQAVAQQSVAYWLAQLEVATIKRPPFFVEIYQD